VHEHTNAVVRKAGGIDISYCAIGIPNEGLQAVPLVQLPVEKFALPITTCTTGHFLTARVAVRDMIEKRSGVIHTITSTHPRTGVLPTGPPCYF